MDNQPLLTEAEWEIVAELVRYERRDLPAELHHTRTGSVRESLRQRLKLVDGLLEKLRPVAAWDAA